MDQEENRARSYVLSLKQQQIRRKRKVKADWLEGVTGRTGIRLSIPSLEITSFVTAIYRNGEGRVAHRSDPHLVSAVLAKIFVGRKDHNEVRP